MRTGIAAGLVAGVLALLAPAGALANGSISGTVTNETAGGTVMANYEVEAYLVGAAAPTASTCTTGGGTYVLSVPAGTYEVRFAGGTATGCSATTTAPEWWDSHGPRKFADPIIVVDLASESNKNASVLEGAQVSGTVTDRSTTGPLANVTVDLIDADGTIPATACTAADGSYLMNRLNGGAFTARFTANGACGNAGNYQTLWYNQSTAQAGASSINIGAPGEIVTGIGAQMFAPPPGPVTLTVQKSGNGTGEVLSSPAGIDCGATCSAPFAVGSPVSLVASPTGGSSFTGWSGAGCSGTAPCTVTMNSAQTVTAAFAAAGGGGGGGGGGADDRPDTKIDSAKIKARKGKAKFEFSGSGGTAPLTFECLLAKRNGSPTFKPCGSPVSFKKLKKGRYTFQVRARDADGDADPSPASQSFKSKRKRR